MLRRLDGDYEVFLNLVAVQLFGLKVNLEIA